MSKNICIIDGHPDGDPARLIHAICDSYRVGAEAGGHTTSLIRIADLPATPLMSVADFSEAPNDAIQKERDKITEADHIVLAFPLWLGSMPAATRAFFEQAACGGFFLDTGDESAWPKRLMKGKSARIFVTMGMPALAYRTLMGSGALKAIERGMLGISGFKPVRHSIYGGAGAAPRKTCEKWLSEAHDLGKSAS